MLFFDPRKKWTSQMMSSFVHFLALNHFQTVTMQPPQVHTNYFHLFYTSALFLTIFDCPSFTVWNSKTIFFSLRFSALFPFAKPFSLSFSFSKQKLLSAKDVAEATVAAAAVAAADVAAGAGARLWVSDCEGHPSWDFEGYGKTVRVWREEEEEDEEEHREEEHARERKVE